MRTSRFTEEQIRVAVQQAEAGIGVPELCRKYGVAQATFYRWRQKYGARAEGLTLRIPRRKSKYASWVRVPLPTPTQPNEQWSLDFMSDALADGRRFRILTVLDLCTRECLALEAATHLPAARVTPVLDRVVAQRGAPPVLRLDNGSEFTGRHFDAWAYQQQIRLDFIRPGRPVENAFIESFNGRLRDECLNAHW